MNTSPLQFARDFAKLKSDLASQPSHDLRLLRLVAFWPDLERHRDDKTYQSYFDEYIPLLRGFISVENLHDLSLEELQHILETLRSVDDAIKPDVCGRQMSTSAPMDDRSNIEIHTVALHLAKMLFYVGRIEEGIGVIADLIGAETCSSTELDDLDSFSELGALRILCERIETSNPQLYQALRQIVNAWEYEKQSLSHEQANCLFVEKDGQGKESRSEPLRFRHDAADVDICQPQNKATDGCHPERSRRAAQAGIHNWRGRMRTLTGSVETRKRPSRDKDIQDHLAFDNQVKSSDDPFVGVVYDSFQAVRCILKAEGMKDKSSASFNAHFSIKDSPHTFTGDSIGLAAALVTYTQLLKPDVTRLERFITSEVAFTGGISPDGRITPVNEATLEAKITRAFFSPVKYLVLPEGNIVAAKQLLERLRQRYPRRRLHLVAAERLSDVIENHNVVRPQRVCIGEYVVRKVSRYSRTSKIQVPLLAMLAYFLLCLIYPKAWLGFDWNPEYVKLTKTGFDALNADSVSLWAVEFKCGSIEGLEWQIGDLDGDGKSEVAIAPTTNSACSTNVNLFVYNREGHLQFRKHCAILGEYPGDTTLFQSYNAHQMKFIRYEDRVIILTITTQCFPSRSHIKLWSATGDLLGWYINAGTVLSWQKVNKEGVCEELIFHGINNRVGSVCLFVLSQDSSFGVSPPYSSTGYDLSWVKRGNQLKYLIFPPTDYNRALNRKYNTSFDIHSEGHGVIVVQINEGNPEENSYVYYSLDSNLRVINVKAGDPFFDHRKDLANKGKLSHVDSSDYLTDLRDAVIYWTDSGWVTEGELRAAEK